MSAVDPMQALAKALCSADGLDPDARERGAGPLWEHYQAQAARLLTDPAPLLAALAEAGLLAEEWGIPDGLAGLQKRTFHSQGMAEALSNDRPVTRRYVTDWTDQ